jgi:hypothetical protein
MDKFKSYTKKVGLGQGLEALLKPDFTSAPTRVHEETNPDLVLVSGAKGKFIQLAKDFYEQIYPGCKIYSGVEMGENINFICGDFLRIYFRVQAEGAFWPSDTLVIANIYYTSADSLLELLSCIIVAHKEVGYCKLGFESPGKREMHLIKRFGFEHSEKFPRRWTISIAALEERIAAGSEG